MKKYDTPMIEVKKFDCEIVCTASMVDVAETQAGMVAVQELQEKAVDKKMIAVFKFN